MPKLIVNRKKPNKTPPCGRKITYINPHSPFQKLIESKRVSTFNRFGRSLSYKEIAAAISTGEHPINAGTLWIWTHNQNGFPSPRSCKTEHLEKLSTFLKIPLPLLKETLDSSKHRYTSRETSHPAQSLDALDNLIQVLKNDKRVKIDRKWLLNLALTFHASAKASMEAPSPSNQ